ncbi:hypothetical protein [Terrabacter sp. Ter38]|uniref:hypothetical protein n=1 Tax=Terrabacter sp. Ter38 TaxID=2926030 RepID=UPI00211982E2|nr:hypothetical protein [Terrabacter sp. Ter38]
MYNSASYFEKALLAPTGFREYDARWVISPTPTESEIGLNYVGVRELGRHLGTFLRTELLAGSSIVVGHDFREYSENVKNALVIGLLQAGMNVHDIGLTTTPAAYFAQFHLNIDCVAMVTASHNDNGWTGIKMGHRKASTFGPEEMDAFRHRVLSDEATDGSAASGTYKPEPGVRSAYIQDLVAKWSPRFQGLPRLRVAVECGNGTSGLYAPELLKRLGFDVAEGNVRLDWNFPNFNPNPESIPFLKSVENLVASTDADLGLCFDGDGDRLGVVDETGSLVFSDRVGLLIAKFLQDEEGFTSPFVIDVKSTSLFESELDNEIVWSKTGHSYVKATVAKSGAIAGFERSGHFFFSDPLGYGFDDACVAALVLLWVLIRTRDANPQSSLSALLATAPLSHSSPNRQPRVPDEDKYEAVETLAAYFVGKGTLAGEPIEDVNRLNGVRLTLPGGSWLLIRASSNSPNLVVIAETFDSDGSLLSRIDDDVRSAIQATGLDIGPFESLAEF